MFLMPYAPLADRAAPPPGSISPGAAATGDAILALARLHVGEPYVLGARAPMANTDWHGPWDCAEFASWCLYQASGILFGVEPRHDPLRADAYTGYWASQARAADAMIPAEQAAGIAGALLLREPQSGRVGHIAISDGTGGTVEAHSSKRGVIAGAAGGRRWDCGILVPGIRHFANAAPVALAPPPAGILRLTEPLTRGDEVARLQGCLAALDFHPGAQDGVYGPQTEAAVAAFQAASGLLVDGELGPQTRKALQAQKNCGKL
jgi:hypothetical protein